MIREPENRSNLPLLAGFEHSAWYVGTTEVSRPFQIPLKIRAKIIMP